MINKIRETRFRSKDDTYVSILEMREEDFFDNYGDLDTEIAKELVSSYLLEKGDDARADQVEIEHDKANKMVCIQCKLSYMGNEHTDYNS